MKKGFFLFAAVIMAAFVSCEKEQNVLDPTETPAPSNESVVTLTVNATKSIDSKALAVDGKATWASGEKVLVFKEGKATSIGYLEPESVGSADAHLTGSVNITGVSEGDKLDLVYVGNNTTEPFSFSYNGQVGTIDDISNKYDYAKAQVTVSTISGSNASATDADFANNQFIVKFNLKDSGGSALSATKFTVSAASGKLVQSYSTAGDTFTPVYGDIEVNPTSATDVIYVALRNDSGSADRYLLTATSGGKDYVYARSGVSFSNGTIYQKNMKLYAIGTYTIVGDNTDYFTTAWAPTETKNDLSLITEGDDIGKYGIDISVTTSAAFEYKIVQDHDWDVSWPGKGAANASYGYKTAADKLVPGANTLHVVFDPGTGSVTFYPEAATYTVLGTFIGNPENNWNASYTATNMAKQADGTYTYKHTHVEPGTYEFKVVGNHSFDWNYGVTANGENCTYTVTSPCDLTFIFNYRTGAITVEESYPTMSITIDGKFSDWATGYEVAGETAASEDNILKMKAVGIGQNMYLYFEIKNAALDYSDTREYSNILQIYMSDGTGTSGWSYWKEKFNKSPNVWILVNHALSFTSFDIANLTSGFVLDGDIVKVELCVPRAYNSILSADTALVGAIVNTQYVEGGSWKGSYDATGVVPAHSASVNMYKVFFQ